MTRHRPQDLISDALSTRNSGAALVVTLAILVLLLGLTVGLFLTANSELRTASLYKNAQGVRELADTCVNLVQAQIKDATTENAGGAPGSRSTWASQPGMIRTYANSTNAAHSYKLYSWRDPRPVGDSPDAVPTDWWQNKAIYTDLNEPVPDSEIPSDTNLYRYPIAYPPASNTDAPLGYSVVNAPLASGGNFTNAVPMPVQWIYVLRDGALVAPSPTAGGDAAVAGASDANPIVGRIAYWTDDESAKVNLNTSAGGPFWMTPVYATTAGANYANFQPMQFEFQSFPGHPARTDLRAVFSDLPADNSTNSLYAFAPRIQYGGSMAAIAMAANSAANTNAVKLDSDRLLASIGEARFSATNSLTVTRSDFIIGGSWPERVERSKFLMTTTSRSPEITLYGTPRISIWPEPADSSSAGRTPYDSLIAFCASLKSATGTNAYYFDRANSASATEDIGRARNMELLGYLDKLMSSDGIPGTASSGFAAKGGASDRAQIQTEIFDYIRCVNLTDTHPTTGNTISFALSSSVIPSERLADGSATHGFGRFPTLNQFGIVFAATAASVVPTSNVPENKSLQNSVGGPATILSANQTRVMALPVIELAVPTAGSSLQYQTANISLRLRGLENLSITSGTQNVSPWGGASSELGSLPGGSSYNSAASFLSKNNGGYLFHTSPLRTMAAFKPLRGVNGFSGAPTDYPVSEAFTMPTGGTMTVSSSAPLFLDIITPTTTVTVTIPAFSSNVSVPTLNAADVLSAFTSSSTTVTSPPEMAWSFHNEWIGVTNAVPVSITNGTSATSIKGRTSYVGNNSPTFGLIYGSDSVLALATKTGDYRLVMAKPDAGAENFSVVTANPSNAGMRHRFFSPRTQSTGTNNIDVPGSNIEPLSMGIMPPRGNSFGQHPRLPSSMDYPLGFAHPRDWGDFDNGYPTIPDGPYINLSDEGEVLGLGSGTGTLPYFGQTRGDSVQITIGNASAIAWSSPNREICSPVAFGSLPSAALQGHPWQNLLFRPAPISTNTAISTGGLHPGASGMKWDGSTAGGAPPDHYLLDYFWMPVVEPWAISERFSTAGRINMNYRITPFDYIRRETALYALLKTEVIPSVPSVKKSANPSYGWNIGYSKMTASSELLPNTSTIIERECNVPETLKAFEQRLNNGKLFHSATEICDLALVPKGIANSTNSSDAPTYANISTFWNNNRMTGDNLRELPYRNIYPRLTTRSNTFTVHYRVQVLKKRPSGTQALWDETKDNVVSELRGSTLIERFLDPSAVYPDYATSFDSSPSLESSYRFRILHRSDFTP